ncbi:MAG TPA: hypothetical protein VFU47_07020, partial [Armatimonadota bacterium]|nr:hypothetical protein [Armatimonadota bacterium]
MYPLRKVARLQAIKPLLAFSLCAPALLTPGLGAAPSSAGRAARAISPAATTFRVANVANVASGETEYLEARDAARTAAAAAEALSELLTGTQKDLDAFAGFKENSEALLAQFVPLTARIKELKDGKSVRLLEALTSPDKPEGLAAHLKLLDERWNGLTDPQKETYRKEYDGLRSQLQNAGKQLAGRRENLGRSLTGVYPRLWQLVGSPDPGDSKGPRPIGELLKPALDLPPTSTADSVQKQGAAALKGLNTALPLIRSLEATLAPLLDALYKELSKWNPQPMVPDHHGAEQIKHAQKCLVADLQKAAEYPPAWIGTLTARADALQLESDTLLNRSLRQPLRSRAAVKAFANGEEQFSKAVDGLVTQVVGFQVQLDQPDTPKVLPRS